MSNGANAITGNAEVSVGSNFTVKVRAHDVGGAAISWPEGYSIEARISRPLVREQQTQQTVDGIDYTYKALRPGTVRIGYNVLDDHGNFAYPIVTTLTVVGEPPPLPSAFSAEVA